MYMHTYVLVLYVGPETVFMRQKHMGTGITTTADADLLMLLLLSAYMQLNVIPLL